ncbi:50S ribosomal protein L25/general stress protein Ctc [Leptospira sp. GIMC2001]|uniref:50S ribosomal protein L25/general stress protein Ctc n=1 Tax=Leptospira sp. GIMC2001 TaxID=1513297 RepID=UPI00234A54CC|nr:50S ribosomal protein L25/general stress protein Ctc [Leptospira sp. GIMC2001]WCL49961.1 50S ribosomal protein L25/general stress protein Ctc [Leptospira sp. GIMC2001]
MENILIKTTPRKPEETGKGPNNRLRASGMIPINVIGSGKSLLASVNEKDMNKIIDSGIRQATLMDLELGSEKARVFVKEIQRFPHTGQIRHIDFYRVTPGKKILTTVSIETTGLAKGSKAGGQFDHLIKQIKVKSTPEDLVDIIKIDVTGLDVGDMIKVSQLPVPKSWEIIMNGDPIVASVMKTRALIAQERADKEGDKKGGKGDKKKGK